MLVQSEGMGVSTEPVRASETEELPDSGAEVDDSPLTEKWEIKTITYQNLMIFHFQMTNLWSKQYKRNKFKLYLYAIRSTFV